MAKLNQKGITLIELLAALVLVSIIVGGAWTALSTGMKYTAVETSKTEIQQDANLFIAKLSAIHRTSDQYEIKLQNDQLLVRSKNNGGWTNFEPIVSKSYEFDGTSINGTSNFTMPVSILPKEEHAKLKLMLADGNRDIALDTTLTRIRTDLPEEEGDEEDDD